MLLQDLYVGLLGYTLVCDNSLSLLLMKVQKYEHLLTYVKPCHKILFGIIKLLTCPLGMTSRLHVQHHQNRPLPLEYSNKIYKICQPLVSHPYSQKAPSLGPRLLCQVLVLLSLCLSRAPHNT